MTNPTTTSHPRSNPDDFLELDLDPLVRKERVVVDDRPPVVYRAEDREELSRRGSHERERLQRRVLTATGLAAVALAATPWETATPRAAVPKAGPSKEKRAQRKRQKAARKAARR